MSLIVHCEQEIERLRVLASYAVLDTAIDPVLRDLPALAVRLCRTPMGAITLVDETRLWLKSRIGLEVMETPRQSSLCNRAIEQRDILIVRDAREDARFRDHPLVEGPPHVRFYAGCPLIAPEGAALGTLCVMDTRVRSRLLPHEEQALRVLSRNVMAHLEVRRQGLAIEAVRNMSDGVVMLDRGGRCLYANAPAAGLLGRERAELTGRTPWGGLPPAARQVLRAACRRALGTREPLELEFHDCAGDRWLAIRFVPGNQGLTVCLRDVTARKDAEGVRRGQVRVIESVVRGDPLATTLRRLVELIESIARGRRCSVLLLGVDGRRLRRGLAPSLPEDFVNTLDGMEIGPETGPCGMAAYRGEPVFVGDIATDPRWRPWAAAAARHALRACCSAPILDGEGHVLGTFAIYHRRPMTSRPRHARLIAEAVNLAAIAIRHQRSDEALRDNAARLTLAVALSHVAFFDWDIETDRVFYSTEWKRQLGYGPSEIEDRFAEWEERLHPEERVQVVARLRALAGDRATHYQAEFRLRHRDGSHRWVLCQGSFLREPGGRATRLLASHIDVTGSKQTELALRDAETRVRLATEAGAIGVWDLDILTGRAAWTKTHGGIWGFPPETLGGTFQELAERTHPEDRERFTSAYRGAIAQRTPYSSEIRVIWPDATQHWVASRGEVFCDAHGAPKRLIGIAVDITESKRVEENLRASTRQAQAYAARIERIREEERTRLARQIHDVLGQELTALKLELFELSRKMSGARRRAQQAWTRRVRAAVVRADHAIGTVQGIALELRPAIIQRLGLAAAAKWVASDFERRTGLRCRFQCTPPELGTDAAQSLALFRILQECLTNVARHARATAATIDLTGSAAGTTLCVRDNGVGIALAVLEDAQALGLAGIRERATACGGTASFESPAGGGTLVTVRLPAATADEPDANPPGRRSHGPAAGTPKNSGADVSRRLLRRGRRHGRNTFGARRRALGPADPRHQHAGPRRVPRVARDDAPSPADAGAGAEFDARGGIRDAGAARRGGRLSEQARGARTHRGSGALRLRRRPGLQPESAGKPRAGAAA